MRRHLIVQAALEAFLEDGYFDTSLRAIARRVGMTHPGLLHHFASKDELLVEVLRRWDLDTEAWASSRPEVRTLDDFVESCVALVDRHREEPALIRLLLTLGSAASDPRHALYPEFQQRSRAARGYFKVPLAALQDGGQLAPGLDLDHAAAWVVAALDGLQLQWLNDSGLNAGVVLRSMLHDALRPR
jgi:AcrR family transcriptional regulator